MSRYTKVLGKRLQLFNDRMRALKMFKSDGQSFSCKIKCDAKLSADDFELPIRIYGTALTEGAHKDNIFYSAEDIKSSISKLLGVPVHIVHKKYDKRRVGYVTDAVWNENIKGMDFTAFIDDREVALDIISGKKKKVSVNVCSYRNPKDGMIFTSDLEYKELSLMDSGQADKRAEITKIIKNK